MNKLYHNPSCSKSRQTFAFLESKGANFTPVLYLTTPLEVDDILSLISRLQCPLDKLIRTGEKLFSELSINEESLNDSNFVADLICTNPKLLQRPIFDDGIVAVIGRPPEDIFSYYSSSIE